MIDKLDDLQSGFASYLNDLGLVYDNRTQVDMLASVLSSQLVLFVGPSGTGKSTAARALSHFFAPASERATVDVRPGWSASEDLLGQYSTFTNSYLPSAATQSLLQVTGRDTTPFITLEEANLSSVEAYAGALITAASSTRFETLTWTLHFAPAECGVPARLVVDKYPRFLATINVDSTAPAPAPKVSGRACVLLLEPPALDQSLNSVAAISNLDRSLPEGDGAGLVGDPHAAWAAVEVKGNSESYLAPLRVLMQEISDALGNGGNVVSPRDVQRCAIYMAWHVRVSRIDDTTEDLVHSAENAILHFVLPGLSSDQFGKAASRLHDVSQPGGLLRARLDKLRPSEGGIFGVPPDFWASLS